MAKYRTKPVEVDALHYDGGFDLEFLGDDETVRSAGDGSGDCVVDMLGAMASGWGVVTLRVRAGQWVVRHAPSGWLEVLDDAVFRSRYEPAHTP